MPLNGRMPAYVHDFARAVYGDKYNEKAAKLQNEEQLYLDGIARIKYLETGVKLGISAHNDIEKYSDEQDVQIATLTAELGPAKACANNLAQNVSVLEQQLGETIKTISTIRKAATKSREIYKEKGAGSAYLFLATIAADPEITPEDLERTENLIEGIDRARAEIAKENTDAE